MTDLVDSSMTQEDSNFRTIPWDPKPATVFAKPIVGPKEIPAPVPVEHAPSILSETRIIAPHPAEPAPEAAINLEADPPVLSPDGLLRHYDTMAIVGMTMVQPDFVVVRTKTGYWMRVNPDDVRAYVHENAAPLSPARKTKPKKAPKAASPAPTKRKHKETAAPAKPSKPTKPTKAPKDDPMEVDGIVEIDVSSHEEAEEADAEKEASTGDDEEFGGEEIKLSKKSKKVDKPQKTRSSEEEASQESGEEEESEEKSPRAKKQAVTKAAKVTKVVTEAKAAKTVVKRDNSDREPVNGQMTIQETMIRIMRDVLGGYWSRNKETFVVKWQWHWAFKLTVKRTKNKSGIAVYTFHFEVFDSRAVVDPLELEVPIVEGKAVVKKSAAENAMMTADSWADHAGKVSKLCKCTSGSERCNPKNVMCKPGLIKRPVKNPAA